MTRLDPTVGVAALGALETVINAALALDPETLRRMGDMQGKVIAVEIIQPSLTVYVAPGAEGVRLMGWFGGTPDTVLRGSAFALARIAATPAGTPAPGLFEGDVVIHGDTELGHRFQRVLASIDLDLEEHLARLTGDVVAHQLGSMARGLLAWSGQAASTMARNAGEYLQEESRALPSRPEWDAHAAAIEALREQSDRIEARLRRTAEKAERKAR